ncbi:MAG TPA: threonine transporter RhtB, partial [Plasticicumulans sp.]|nr:threonine transporter RhtB [Plasticicumulans sp.]
MPLETWLTFFVASWLISLSPGPGALSCMAAGMRHGFRRAAWNILG